MKWREEIGRSGLVMDLMSVALILGVPIGFVVLVSRAFNHPGYHRSLDWHDDVKRMLISSGIYLVYLGVRNWWKHRRSSSESVS